MTAYYCETCKEFVTNKWAKDMAKAMDRDVMALFGGRPTPKAKPLTKWQKCKRFMTKKRYAGRWLTYKLMEHYDIYEGDW